MRDLPVALRDTSEALWCDYASEAKSTLQSRQPEILAVWACSPFIAGTCTRNPDLLPDLITSGELDRSAAPTEIDARAERTLQAAGDTQKMQKLLRALRQREMLRIAWRDLNGAASLNETLCDLSTLATTCVTHALRWSYEANRGKYGEPRDQHGAVQQPVVIGMGKLGGMELNFSSDIDLIFAYTGDGRTVQTDQSGGQTDGKRTLDNQGFFTRVMQQLVQLLSDITADGLVFRVDARLRPFGEAGALVLSFDAMEDYYQTHGRDWERYAMIKARGIAGDEAAGTELLARLRPFVYRKYLDYGAFEALRSMKSMVDAEVKRKRLQHDVKLGPGGIREVEFIGQAFQLIRGGQDSRFQERGIQPVLRLLADTGILPTNAVDELLQAYEFLRRTENRLQMLADQQTHTLPTEPLAQARIAFAMGYAQWEDFLSALQHHRERVQAHFERIFAEPGSDERESGGISPLWANLNDGEQTRVALTNAGYDAPSEVQKLLLAFRQSHAYTARTGQGRARMDRLMPLLIAAAGNHAQSDLVLPRLLHLVDAVARRSVYLSLLAENPETLGRLIELSAASRWIADYLAKHPLLLDELMDPRELYSPPDRKTLGALLATEMQQIDPDDMETQLDRLRNFKHANVLRVAAADVMGALPLMRVSDQLTWIAEAILTQVLDIAMTQMITRYGKPACRVDGQQRTPGFAIIAYGKLGGIELGYGSDLDVVFVHNSAGEAQHTDGAKSVDNSVFFARLAQRIIHIISTFTPAGVLYEVDPRLRPSGTSGLLVSALHAFEAYQQEEAWTWEHQALVRARAIAGDEDVARECERVRREVLQRARDITALREEVRCMREKMWRELATRDSTLFDLKKDPGGIADLEFMVQYLVLAHANVVPAVAGYSDNIRILDSLEANELMPPAQAGELRDIYRAYRDKVHTLDLQGEPATVDASAFSEQRAAVQRYWREMMCSEALD